MKIIGTTGYFEYAPNTELNKDGDLVIHSKTGTTSDR